MSLWGGVRVCLVEREMRWERVQFVAKVGEGRAVIAQDLIVARVRFRLEKSSGRGQHVRQGRSRWHCRLQRWEGCFRWRSPWRFAFGGGHGGTS
jgi:hypothetical protein